MDTYIILAVSLVLSRRSHSHLFDNAPLVSGLRFRSMISVRRKWVYGKWVFFGVVLLQLTPRDKMNADRYLTQVPPGTNVVTSTLSF